jgi:hypothetical protein
MEKLRMIRWSKIKIAITFGALLSMGPIACSSNLVSISSQDQKFIESGSIIISQGVPERSETEMLAGNDSKQLMTPLIGFFPPTTAYVPALNEAWLEVDSKESLIRLHVGSQIVDEVKADGAQLTSPGNYYLTEKASSPSWKASDEYFLNRGLSIPQADDILRYRKGALGKLALFSERKTSQSANSPSAHTAPLFHSAPLWTNEVGGIRVPYQSLASMFESLPLGAPIIVK